MLGKAATVYANNDIFSAFFFSMIFAKIMLILSFLQTHIKSLLIQQSVAKMISGLIPVSKYRVAAVKID